MSQSVNPGRGGGKTIAEREEELLDELEEIKPELEDVADTDLPYAKWAQRYLDVLEEAGR